MEQLTGIMLAALSAAIGSLGPIYVKRGTSHLQRNIRSFFNKNLIFGLFFYIVSVIIFIPALRFGDVSVLYPVISTTYVWISLLSFKMLGERMNAYKWAGVIIIVLGVSIIGFGS